MRLYKGRAELTVMRRAAQIAVGAHMRAMRATRPGVYEYQVMAELLHEFHRHNADISYHPIVGGGANACILHYHANNAELAGRRPAADRRRLRVPATTPPTSPAPSRSTAASAPSSAPCTRSCSRRRKRRSPRCRPGNHWNDPHDAAVQCDHPGAWCGSGLLKGRVPALIKEGAYRRFFMHRTGHWLGMDVHDVGDYKVGDEWRVLEPGMCLTVEPGIYIPAGSKGVPSAGGTSASASRTTSRSTTGGCEVLTAGLPRTPDEIERVMRAA